jgi:DNA (cytosine-5)-methyltransferase 1
MDKNNVDTAKELLTVISFCSGYGGIERGLDLAGVEHRVLAYVEIEAFAIANLVNKMENGLIPPAPIYTDLKTFPAHIFRGCVDIITGGYPCQPFSAAGKRLGTEDPRHLWPYILDHIKSIRPVRCFFENVEGHISLGLREVIGDLEGAGYNPTWGIFSAAEVGAPHQRKRVYILADSKSGEPWQQAQWQGGQGVERRSFDKRRSAKPQRETVADARDPRPSRAGIEPQPGIKIIEPCDSDSTGECGPDMANADRARQQTQRRESGAERETRLTGESGELANTSSQRFGGESQGQLQQPGRAEVVSAGEELADTISQRLEGLTRHGSDSSEPGRQSPQSQRPVSQSGVFSDTTGWLPEPRLGRVVDGCPDRVDRIRLLGNGVVPKTAARAWEILSSRLQKS